MPIITMVENRRHGISPIEMKIALSAISILANGNSGRIDASSLINNTVAPVRFEFPDKTTPDGIVVEAVKDVLDIFWRQNTTQSVIEQKLIGDIRLLKERGLKRKHIMEALKFHLF